MILHWIVSATLLGALLAIIGTCVTPVIARAGLPRRWLWLAAMIVSIGWPVWRAIAPHAAPVAVASAASAIADPAPAAVPARKLPADRTILLTWGALSLLLGGTLALSHWRTLRLMSQWEERSLFDAPIAVAPDFGPAAVGLIRPRVVIPDWVLELPADEQRLVLLHEQQHIRAGDHLVLLAGLSMVVLMPWNIGLWWQLRRLRIGMELDCDARVAPAPRDRPHYAELLLRARTHHQTRRLALALAPAPSALAERLMALLDRARPSRRQLVAWSLTAFAGGFLVARIPVPDLTSLVRHTEQPVTLSVTPAIVAQPLSIAPVHAPHPAPDVAKQAARPLHAADVAAGTAAAAPAIAAAAPVRKPRYDSLLPYVPGSPTMARGTGGGRGCYGDCVTSKRESPTAYGAVGMLSPAAPASGTVESVTAKRMALPVGLPDSLPGPRN